MSAERSTESIIDLLYGELSEEQEREMRAEMADSPELQAEYDEYDHMLGRVRNAMPLQEVSPSIHASILEAARVAAEQPDDRLIRRSAPEKQGFWQRMSGGQGSRVALVAAVLIAGAFVVRFVDRSDSPLHAPASDISAMREAAPAAAALPESNEEPPGDGTVALNEMEDELAIKGDFKPFPSGGEAIADQWSPDNEPPEPIEQAKAESADESLRKELQRSQRERADVKQEPAPEPAATAKPAPRPRKKVSKTKRKRPSTKSKDSMSSLLDTVGGEDDDRGYGQQPQVQGKAGLGAAEGEAEEAAAPSEYRPSKGSISEVDAYFRRGDYGGAISAADDFLKKGTGSRTETANAMFIKAQSLAKQNKTVAAERLLQQIKKNYPQWRSSEIDQQLNELQRKTAPKKQQRKAKPKPKMDEAEKSAPDAFYDVQ